MRLVVWVPSGRTDKRGRPAPLPGRNELESMARASRGLAARVKREETNRVRDLARAAGSAQGWRTPPDGQKVSVWLTWVETSTRRDQDNIRAYEKPLLDGLVRARVMDDDDQRHVLGCSRNRIRVDRWHPGVEVVVQTVDEGNPWEGGLTWVRPRVS